MREIEVLGSGCTKCLKTAALIEQVASSNGVAIHIVKQSNPEIIMQYGVMKTPAVVIDQRLVHSGSIPHRDQVEQWLL